MLTVNTGGTAGTAVTTPKAVTVAEEKPTPVRDAADRAVTISAQVARSSVEVRGVIVSAQGEVMTAAIDGAEGVARAVINGGDVKGAVTTARTDVKGAMTDGRADVGAAVDKARDDIRSAAGGAMRQRVAAVSAKRSAASRGRRAPDKPQLGIACSIPAAFASAPSNRREGADCCALPLRSGEPGPQTRSPVKVTHPLLQRIPAPPPARNPSRAQIPTARTQPASTPRMRPTPRATP